MEWGEARTHRLRGGERQGPRQVPRSSPVCGRQRAPSRAPATICRSPTAFAPLRLFRTQRDRASGKLDGERVVGQLQLM